MNARSPIVTATILAAIMPYVKRRAHLYAPLIDEACRRRDITTPMRLAGFLATIAHESGELRYTAEIASGEAYEGRSDLGNTLPGDGRRFKGRGFIQLTGRDNYRLASIALTGDDQTFILAPETLEEPWHAVEVSAWWWYKHGLNEVMDQGDFRGACGIVNCGSRNVPPGRIRGFADRLSYYSRARKALGITP